MFLCFAWSIRTTRKMREERKTNLFEFGRNSIYQLELDYHSIRRKRNEFDVWRLFNVESNKLWFSSFFTSLTFDQRSSSLSSMVFISATRYENQSLNEPLDRWHFPRLFLIRFDKKTRQKQNLPTNEARRRKKLTNDNFTKSQGINSL